MFDETKTRMFTYHEFGKLPKKLQRPNPVLTLAGVEEVKDFSDLQYGELPKSLAEIFEDLASLETCNTRGLPDDVLDAILAYFLLHIFKHGYCDRTACEILFAHGLVEKRENKNEYIFVEFTGKGLKSVKDSLQDEEVFLNIVPLIAPSHLIGGPKSISWTIYTTKTLLNDIEYSHRQRNFLDYFTPHPASSEEE